MGEGLIGVWDTADGGFFVPVPGANVVVIRQKLSGGDTMKIEVLSLPTLYKIQGSVLHLLNHLLRVIVLMYYLNQQYADCTRP